MAGTERSIVLSEDEKNGMEPTFFINSVSFPDVPPVLAASGDVETWAVRNDSEMDHPFHLHGMLFRVLDVAGLPPAHLGWKDTVNVPRKQTLRFAVRYGAAGIWMHHCHILEHAERGMMAELILSPKNRSASPINDERSFMTSLKTLVFGGTLLTLVGSVSCDSMDMMPKPPSDLKVEPLSGGAHLTWKDNSDNESGFMIERMVGSAAYAALITVPFDTTAHHDATVTSGMTYKYRVMAAPKDGTHDASTTKYSNEVTFTAP